MPAGIPYPYWDTCDSRRLGLRAWVSKNSRPLVERTVKEMLSIPETVSRLRTQGAAWGELAPETKFAGKGCADFQAVTNDVTAALDNLVKIKAQWSAGIKIRNEAVDKALKLSKDVTLAIRIAPEHGEDSPLLRASGFTPQSEIRTGLTRKKSADQAVVAQAAAA